MSTMTDKEELMDWLSELDDPKVLELLKIVKENTEATGDWWNEISEAEKKGIQQGIKDLEAGRVTPHEEVRKKYEKWL